MLYLTNIRQCPRCGGFLLMDGRDIACLICGYRISNFLQDSDDNDLEDLEIACRYLITNNTRFINCVPDHMAVIG